MPGLFLKVLSTSLPLLGVVSLGAVCIGAGPRIAWADPSSMHEHGSPKATPSGMAASSGTAPAPDTPPTSGVADQPDGIQDATLHFVLKEVGGGLGYEWGKGTLHFGGQDHPFEIGGGGIASLGYVAIKGTGTVKNLERLDHFDGTYWTVKADAAVGSGTGVAVLENQYGVKVSLTMQMKGAHLGASVMRLRFRLLDDATDKLATR